MSLVYWAPRVLPCIAGICWGIPLLTRCRQSVGGLNDRTQHIRCVSWQVGMLMMVVKKPQKQQALHGAQYHGLVPNLVLRFQTCGQNCLYDVHIKLLSVWQGYTRMWVVVVIAMQTGCRSWNISEHVRDFKMECEGFVCQVLSNSKIKAT